MKRFLSIAYSYVPHAFTVAVALFAGCILAARFPTLTWLVPVVGVAYFALVPPLIALADAWIDGIEIDERDGA